MGLVLLQDLSSLPGTHICCNSDVSAMVGVEPQEQMVAEVEAQPALEEAIEQAIEVEEAEHSPAPPLLPPQVSLHSLANHVALSSPPLSPDSVP